MLGCAFYVLHKNRLPTQNGQPICFVFCINTTVSFFVFGYELLLLDMPQAIDHKFVIG